MAQRSESAVAAAEVTIRLFPIFYDRRRGDVAATAFVVVEQYSNTQTYCVLLLLLHTQAALLWWLMLPFTMGRVIKSKDVLVAQKSLFVIENTQLHTHIKRNALLKTYGHYFTSLLDII